MIRYDNYTIDDLIHSLEENIERDFEQNSSSFIVKTGGRAVKMWYPNRAQADKAKEGFRKFIVSDRSDYTAIFKFWEADFKKYLPEDYTENGRRMCSSQRGRVKIVMGYLLSCADYRKQIYYYCTDPIRQFIGAHEMVNPYYLWGLYNDMILTHSACVGVDGKGVLLVAEGGGGKSTLSVGCLMHGLDFVSDDYTMLSGSGKLVGIPVYSNIGLTPDSYDMLNPSYPVHWIHEANKNKKFMDVSDVHNFIDELEIKALVTTKLTAGETKIYKIDSQPLVLAFHQSSMRQVLSMGNSQYTLEFINRLKNLSCYQIELGTDVNYNAEFLREFIKKEL